MRRNYIELIKESFGEVIKNPSLLIPDLVFIISTIIFTSLFLHFNGLLNGAHLDYDNVITFVTAIFNSKSALLKLIISFVVITSVNIFLGLTTSTTKYVMCRKVVQRKDVNIIQCFIEGREYMFSVFGIKFILSLLYFIPFVIFTILNFENKIIVFITSLIVLIIWAILKIIFFYAYPTLMIDTKYEIIRTLKESYLYFKENKAHTIICTGITFLLTAGSTYHLGLLGKLLQSIILNPPVTSLFTVFTTITLAIISIGGLVFTFKSY